jgi:hypothetical protein
MRSLGGERRCLTPPGPSQLWRSRLYSKTQSSSAAIVPSHRQLRRRAQRCRLDTYDFGEARSICRRCSRPTANFRRAKRPCGTFWLFQSARSSSRDVSSWCAIALERDKIDQNAKRSCPTTRQTLTVFGQHTSAADGIAGKCARSVAAALKALTTTRETFDVPRPYLAGQRLSAGA